MSSASSVRALLEQFAAGRARADDVAIAVAAAYYRAPESAPEPLRELARLIEREAPGVVELAARGDGPGFEVRPVGRTLPEGVELELRRMAPALLADSWGLPRRGAAAPVGAAEGWWVRLVRAVRRAFSGAS